MIGKNVHRFLQARCILEAICIFYFRAILLTFNVIYAIIADM